MSKTFVLKDHFYEFQQDNFNPDGTSNMVRTKEWGRFNQCFISSAVMSFNQCLTRLRSKGIEPIDGFKTSYIDEIAYMATLLSNLNKDNSAWNDNQGRYQWTEHCKLLNTLIQNSFKKKVPGKWIFHRHGGNHNVIINVIKTNYQPIVGINIKHHHGSGSGHVITVVGWKEDDDGKVLGLIVNDPAGNILKGYRNAKETDGKEAFYPLNELKYMLLNGHIMYFKEELS